MFENNLQKGEVQFGTTEVDGNDQFKHDENISPVCCS
jgi:hypothetical protein